MPAYIIRVELIGSPSGSTYENLHDYMRSWGFQQTAMSVTGMTLSLPHATYHGQAIQGTSLLATSLRDGIQTNVWTKAKVLAISYAEAILENPT